MNTCVFAGAPATVALLGSGTFKDSEDETWHDSTQVKATNGLLTGYSLNTDDIATVRDACEQKIAKQ